MRYWASSMRQRRERRLRQERHVRVAEREHDGLGVGRLDRLEVAAVRPPVEGVRLAVHAAPVVGVAGDVRGGRRRLLDRVGIRVAGGAAALGLWASRAASDATRRVAAPRDATAPVSVVGSCWTSSSSHPISVRRRAALAGPGVGPPGRSSGAPALLTGSARPTVAAPVHALDGRGTRSPAAGRGSVPPGEASHRSATHRGPPRPSTLAQMPPIRVALAQVAPRLGDLDANLARHHALIEEARGRGVRPGRVPGAGPHGLPAPGPQRRGRDAA